MQDLLKCGDFGAERRELARLEPGVTKLRVSDIFRASIELADWYVMIFGW